MRRFTTFGLLLVCLASALILAGCQGFGQNQTMDDEQAALAPPPPPPGMYFDFEDVRIPDGMSLDRDNSFVYHSDKVKTGVLVFTSNRKTEDLLGFFETNMPGDGWSLVSSFKYRKNILIYTKTDKIALVVVNQFGPVSGTKTEIWVAPLRDSNGQEASKPLFRSSPESSRGEIVPFLKREAPREETLPAS